MICLRCGHCCIMYDVIIPLKELPEDVDVMGNLDEYGKYKPSGEACWNLVFDIKTKESICLIHDKSFYIDSPCDMHGQIEQGNTNCRMGDYILNRKLCGVGME